MMERVFTGKIGFDCGYNLDSDGMDLGAIGQVVLNEHQSFLKVGDLVKVTIEKVKKNGNSK